MGEDVVLAIHEAQIAEHGGSAGIRDWDLLDSALARPKNVAAYAGASAPALAAQYAIGIIKNHPFIDGNKRVGAVLLETFLEDHGYRLESDDGALLAAIMALASGQMTEDRFVAWVGTQVARRQRPLRKTRRRQP